MNEITWTERHGLKLIFTLYAGTAAVFAVLCWLELRPYV